MFRCLLFIPPVPGLDETTTFFEGLEPRLKIGLLHGRGFLSAVELQRSAAPDLLLDSEGTLPPDLDPGELPKYICNRHEDWVMVYVGVFAR